MRTGLGLIAMATFYNAGFAFKPLAVNALLFMLLLFLVMDTIEFYKNLRR